MMTVQQYRGLDALPTPTDKGPKEGALLLVFGTTEHLQRPDVQQVLSAWARTHVVVGASSDALISTAGLESLPVFTYLRFEQTRVRLASAPIPDPEASYEVGRQLGQVLAEPQLRYVLLLADGFLL
jgi:hypothetical protein